MPNLDSRQQQFVGETWKGRWDGVLQAQNLALNWLFAMNTGGLAGVLAYAASKGGSYYLTGALICFAFGLFCMIGYAACMFYVEERMFYAFRSDLVAFYAEKIEWGELVRRDNARPNKYKICEYLAWAAGLSGAIGVVLSTIVIL